VLDVLLDNALAHGVGVVSIRRESIAGAPVIMLSDEGSFAGEEGTDPFRTSAAPGDQHGFGLGIAHALADAEGARVRLANRHPTTFELILPRVDD
jgi:C4-dicarboxylate-specific signal transduction histidine kinase